MTASGPMRTDGAGPGDPPEIERAPIDWVERALIVRACSDERGTIVQAVKPEHFARPVNGEAFRLALANGRVPLVSLFFALCEAHGVDAANGVCMPEPGIENLGLGSLPGHLEQRVLEGYRDRSVATVASKLAGSRISPSEAASELAAAVHLADGSGTDVDDCVMTARESYERPEPAVRLLFERGAFPFGYYSLVHGHGGTGKTRLMCHMIVHRLLGIEWLGWEPTEEPFRPLIVTLDMSRPAVTAILVQIARAVGGDGAVEQVLDSVHIVGAPELTRRLNGSSPDSSDLLIRWIERSSATFCLLDSLSRTNQSGVDSQEGLGPSISMIERIATVTNTDLCAIHHDRKDPAGAPIGSSAGANARGPSNLVDNSRFALNVDEHAGRFRIRWHKISFGPARPERFYTLDADGSPVHSASPAEVADINRTAVLDAVRSFARPDSPAELSDILSSLAASDITMTRRTAMRHLADLVDSGTLLAEGSKGHRSYRLCDTS